MAESAAVIALHNGGKFKGTQGSTFGVPVTDLWKKSTVRDGNGVLGRIFRDSKGQARWAPLEQHTGQRDGSSRAPGSKPPRLNLGRSDCEVAAWRQRMRRDDAERARRRRARGKGASSGTNNEDESAIVGADGESPKGTTRVTDSPTTPRSPTETGQQDPEGQESLGASSTQSRPQSTPSSTPPSPPPSPPQSSPGADLPKVFKAGWLIILLLCVLGLLHLPRLLYLLWLHVDKICRERFRDKQDVDLADVFLIIALLCIGVRYASRRAFSASNCLRVTYWCSLIWVFLYFVPEFSWTLSELYDCAFYRMGWQGLRHAILPLLVLVIAWLARPYWPEICGASRRAPRNAREAKDAVASQMRKAAGACTDVKVHSWAWVWHLIDRGLAAFFGWVFRLKELGESPSTTPNTILGVFPRTSGFTVPNTQSTPEVRLWADKCGLDGFVELARYREARPNANVVDSPISTERPSPDLPNRQDPSDQADQRSTSISNESIDSDSGVRRSSASETAAVFRQLVRRRIAQRALRGDPDSTADLQGGGSPGPGSPERKDSGSQRSPSSPSVKSPNRRSPGKSPLRQMWRPDDILEGEAGPSNFGSERDLASVPESPENYTPSDDGTSSKTRSPSDQPHVNPSPFLSDIFTISEEDARRHMFFKVFRNSDGCRIDSDGTFRSPSGHTLGKIDQGRLLGCNIIAGGQLWFESIGPGSKIGQLSYDLLEEVSGETGEAALPDQGGGEQIQIKFAYEDAQQKQTYAIWLVNLPEAEEYHKELATARGESKGANQALLDYFEGCTIDGNGNLLNTNGVVDGKLDLADPRDAVLAATKIGAGSSIFKQSSGSSVGIIVDLNAPKEELLNFERGEPAIFELVYHHFGPPVRLRSVKFVMKAPRADNSDLVDLLPDVLYTGKGFSIVHDATSTVHQLAFTDGSFWGSVRPKKTLHERCLPGCSVGEDGIMRDELSRALGVASKIMISKRDYAKVETGDYGWCKLHYTIFLDPALYRKREHEWFVPLLIRKPTSAAAASEPATALSESGQINNLDLHIGNKVYGKTETTFAAVYSIPHVLSLTLAEVRSWAPWLNSNVNTKDLDKGVIKNIEVTSDLWNTEVFLEKLVKYNARDQGRLPITPFEEALAMMPGFVDFLTQIDDATANYTNRADIATHMTARALHIQDLLQELVKEDMDETAAQFICTGHDSGAAAQHETQRTNGGIMRSHPFSPRAMLGPKRRGLAGQAQGTDSTSPSGAQGSPMSIATPRVRFVIDTEPGKTWWRAEPTPIIVTPQDIVHTQLLNLTPAQYIAREREMKELVEIRRHFERIGNEANNLIRSLWSDYQRDVRDITAFETRRDALVDAFGLHVFQALDRVYGEGEFVRQEKSSLQEDIYLYGGHFQQVLQRIRDEWDMCGTLIGLSYDDLAPPFPEIERPKKPKITPPDPPPGPQVGKRFPTYDESVKTALKEVDGIWQQARTINEQEQKLLKRRDARGREQLARLRQSEGKSQAYILRRLDNWSARGRREWTSASDLFARSAPDPGTYTLSDLVGLKVEPDGFVYDNQRRPIAKLVQGDAEQVAELNISTVGTLKDTEGYIQGLVEPISNPAPQTTQQSSSGADATEPPDEAQTIHPAPTLDLFHIYPHQAHTTHLHRAHLAHETLQARAQRLWTALITPPNFTPETLPTFLESVTAELEAITSLVETDVLRSADEVAANPLVEAAVRARAGLLGKEVREKVFAWREGVAGGLVIEVVGRGVMAVLLAPADGVHEVATVTVTVERRRRRRRGGGGVEAEHVPDVGGEGPGGAPGHGQDDDDDDEVL
ncbi:hypothetical protein EJ03DRAFT_377404 [Teratosphaeria nubilosa]|uniref:Uncharacterized protein n=1 Tax=Teratosphaeria nubilosa TaxID=161662 RepID=A0A6G1L0W9_9PEZI|nr:hypothetical protein EJ03DRAFT_377404 [Teratosphaeria nubilosa]